MTRASFAAVIASLFVLAGCASSVTEPAAAPAASPRDPQREQLSADPQPECENDTCPRGRSTAKGAGPFKQRSKDDALVANPGGVPPPMTLSVGGQVVKDKVGTYCSSGNRQGVCADAAGPSGPTVRLPQGKHDLSFQWRWRVEALQTTICLDRSFHECPRSKTLDLGERSTTSLDPGSYMVAVFARWEGGDASYEWFLQVD